MFSSYPPTAFFPLSLLFATLKGTQQMIIFFPVGWKIKLFQNYLYLYLHIAVQLRGGKGGKEDEKVIFFWKVKDLVMNLLPSSVVLRRRNLCTSQ